MDNETLRLEVRDEVGGERPKRLRKDGYIPAIVYGHEMESVPAQIKESDLRRFLSSRGKNSVFTTEFAAEHDFCGLIKDIRYDPFGNSITHVDIQRVSLDEKIHASVPIKTVGKEKLDRTKSVIVHQLNEVTIEC
ncbi:MAG: 50S ribosomal protein L25, partial [Clostridia bacterium]|nr:50S ribosomal protein L25 [Clostridia bacterium]